jgi:DNA-binding response OmpR family regulator
MNKILYVHDDQESPQERIQALAQAGYEVIAEQEGRRSLTLIQREKPSLLISDVLIHSMTGFELCHHVRTELTPIELPVLLLSGIFRGVNYLEESERVGAQGYLVHPFTPEQLVDTVKEMLRSGERPAA